jgi:hypothetical protein
MAIPSASRTFRNFDYRSLNDFTPRYETREFSLAHVSGVDLFISYWQVGPVGHTFVSFTFDDGTARLCISIEARPEVGEEFVPLQSMFKQFELVYAVDDERDVVGVRTDHRDEEVYCYRMRVPPEAHASCCWFTLSGSTSWRTGRSSITC